MNANRSFFANKNVPRAYVTFAPSTKQKEALEDAGMKIHNLHVFFFLAYLETTDFLDQLEDEKINGHYLHHYAKLVERLLADYLRQMKQMYGKKEYSLLYDFGVSVSKRLERDIQIFRLSFIDYMLNTSIQRKDLIAQMEVAITLTDFAIDLYDKFFEKYNKLVGYDISRGYKWMRIDKVRRNLGHISEEIGKREPNDLNFSESERCQMAYTIIANKILKGDLIEEAALNALQLNHLEHKLNE